MQQHHYKSFIHLNHDQIQNLLQCTAVCKSCSALCLLEGSKESCSMCNECAEICDLAVKLSCCQSDFTPQILELCSQACKKCGDLCQKMDAQHCKECGEICMRCAETCSYAKN